MDWPLTAIRSAFIAAQRRPPDGDGHTLRVRRPVDMPVHRGALSPDGRYAAAGVGPDLIIYDAQTGKQLSELYGSKLPDYFFTYMRFSHDSRRLLSRFPTSGYDLTTLGHPITHEHRKTATVVQSANFDPSGQQIVTARWDNAASIESVADAHYRRTLQGHAGRGRNA